MQKCTIEKCRIEKSTHFFLTFFATAITIHLNRLINAKAMKVQSRCLFSIRESQSSAASWLWFRSVSEFLTEAACRNPCSLWNMAVGDAVCTRYVCRVPVCTDRKQGGTAEQDSSFRPLHPDQDAGDFLCARLRPGAQPDAAPQGAAQRKGRLWQTSAD